MRAEQFVGVFDRFNCRRDITKFPLKINDSIFPFVAASDVSRSQASRVVAST